jgi:hypothetical protein
MYIQHLPQPLPNSGCYWPCRNAAVNVNSVPLWSDIRHLFDTWEKNRGPAFDTFPPGTEYHFARNSFSSGLRAHVKSSPFFPVVKERPVTNKYYSCWIGVVGLPRDRHGYQLQINHQHTSYNMKLSVHCAFEEGFVGLRFVFDALITDNSTGIRQKLKQSVPISGLAFRCSIEHHLHALCYELFKAQT